MSGFKSTLFIASGETNAIYTLKKKRLHHTYIGFKKHTEVRSDHVCILSSDPDIAFSKALIYSEQHGIPLETTRDEMKQLREITRRSSDQQSSAQSKPNGFAKTDDLSPRDKIARGIYPFGKHEGRPFHSAPPEYISWLIDSIPTLEEGILREMAIAVEKTCSHFKLPVADKKLHLGSIGEEIDQEATVVDSRIIGPKTEKNKFAFKLISFVTKTGVMLIVKTSRFDPKIGDKLHINGVVKNHGEFKGQAQTELDKVSIK